MSRWPLVLLRATWVKINNLTAVTPEITAAIERLLGQLNPEKHIFSPGALQEVVASPNSFLLVAQNEAGTVLGMATVVVYATPEKRKAALEDVVVDADARGQGVGQRLIEEALVRAREAGAQVLQLTSNPRREAANRLYPRAGFDLYETNVYRYQL